MSDLAEQILLSIKADYSDLVAQSAQAKQAVDSLKEAIKSQKTELDNVAKTQGTNSDQYQKLSQDIKANELTVTALNKVQQQANAQVQVGINLNQSQQGSIVGLRAEFSKMQNAYINLSQADRENQAVGGAMLKQIAEKNAKLKSLEGAYGDNRRSVGGYKEAIEEATKELNIHGVSLEGLKSGFEKSKGAIFTAEGSFKGLNAVMKANVIGLIVVAIMALVEAFKGSEEGQNKFAKIMAVINSVTFTFKEVLKGLGEKIIWVFENPKQALEDFTKLIKENLLNRFQGLLELIPHLGSAMNKMFHGDFAEAGKEALDAVAKVTLGVTDMTEKIGKAGEKLKEFGGEIQKNADTAAKVADMRAKADKLERQEKLDDAKLAAKIAELRDKAADKEQFSAKQRIEFMKEARGLEKEEEKAQLGILNLRLNAQKLENTILEQTKENKDKLIESQAAVFNAKAEFANKDRMLLKQLNRFTREDAADLKAQRAEDEKARKDAYDATLKSLQDEELKFDTAQLEKLKNKTLKQIDYDNQKLIAHIKFLEAQKTLDQKYAEDGLKLDNDIAKAKLQLETNTSKESINQKKNESEVTKILATQGQDFLKQGAKLLGEKTKAGKTMSIAAATIATYESAVKAFSSLAGIPIIGPALGAAASGLAIATGLETVANISKAAGGGSFKTTGPTLLMVGDNPGGVERVDVTPISGKGETTVNPNSGLIKMAGGGTLTADGGFAARSMNMDGLFDYDKLSDAMSKQQVITRISDIHSVSSDVNRTSKVTSM